MSADTPRPERVTLTDEERDTLACVATGHEPDLCDCHDGYRDNGDRFCEYAQETFAAVERILAAREQALREEIAAEIEADYPDKYEIGYVANRRAARIARGETR